MKIRKDGIYKSIDNKDFGIFQKSGWEKVITEPIAEPKVEIEPEPIKAVEEFEIIEPEPIKDEEIIPKAKKKKKA